MRIFVGGVFVAVVAVLGCLVDLGAVNAAETITSPLARAIPTNAKDCSLDRVAQVAKAAEELDRWAAAIAWQRATTPDDTLRRVDNLLLVKNDIDRRLNEFLKLRGGVAPLVHEKDDRQFVRNYFAITSRLIDLSGRLRYTLRDGINNAIAALATTSPESIEPLVESIVARNGFVGTEIFAPYLSDTESPISLKLKRHVIDLIGRSGDASMIAPLLAMIRTPAVTADLKLSGIVAIMNIGVPQDWREGQAKTEQQPPITAGGLANELAALRFGPEFDPSYTRTQQHLLPRLRTLAQKGCDPLGIRTCGMDVRIGDWLLIRNPSPYNQITDLAPGLFTHVGVVTSEQGTDGKVRLVVVEIPERGDRVPATNVDAYLARTLHYFFLRHPDPDVQTRMATVAGQVIGNETQFDLTFRNERVRQLKGKPLPGALIHTYCAGLLHLCAQETEAPLSDFFPLIEGPPGGNCLENLAKLGMSIGDDFVSPTSALLSSKLEIVGRREPMYDPGREVKEAVYDYFANSLVKKTLQPSPDAFQSLREKVAGLSKTNPWLAKALAQTNNVSEHMDLESAAKAAAVIETLDEIADSSLHGYLEARQAMNTVDERALPMAERAKLQTLRNLHANLYSRWLTKTVSPRDLRVQLVQYYSTAGQRRLDARFFTATKAGDPPVAAEARPADAPPLPKPTTGTVPRPKPATSDTLLPQ